MSDECCCSKKPAASPMPLRFTAKDYLKAFISWLFAFMRTFKLEPGLYYTGSVYDTATPLLVTCNYHMTVFLLWKIVRNLCLRILVIDTKGINVWCASGKGQFSAAEILAQIDRYPREILGPEKEPLTLVLPKLSLSGVCLEDLKKEGIHPRIRPIYARQLPAYLRDLPLKNRNKDIYLFSLRDRLFTLPPSLVQILFYSFYIAAGMFVFDLFFPTGIHWQILPLNAGITVGYILLFPLLPTKKFALKGVVFYLIQAAALTGYYFGLNRGGLSLQGYVFYLLFLAGANLYFPLYYTGNSGVSNYSLVKKEIVAFLPLTVLFYAAALVVLILKGVSI